MSREREAVKYRRYGLILYYILKIVGKTLNIKIITNDKIKENEESYVFAFWHNKLVAPSLCLDYIEKRAVLASPSKDGELISVPLEKMGFHMVRGSSDKNSTSSLISLIKLMKKGYSIGTPVDGPKGPIYEVSRSSLRASLTPSTWRSISKPSSRRSESFSGRFFSITMRRMLIAWRRRAYGSFSPVGIWPIPKRPVRVSSLSAIASESACKLLISIFFLLVIFFYL